MDPIKLAGIKDWPTPTKVKEVRSFLSFCNFYRKFIGNYANISTPLTHLTKKTTVFQWTPDCEEAFGTLKQAFASSPILSLPDPAKPYYLETDASKLAVGAVLRQPGPDGTLLPCGYLSHTLTPTKQNYQIYDRELLAVVRALKEWRHLLHGSPHPIVI